MHGIWKLVNRWLSTDLVAHMAERVAGRSRLDVWQRVKDRLPLLGPAESRGYLRARAIGIVREETRRLATQEGASVRRLCEQIEAAALQLLIASMVEQQLPRHQMVKRRAA